MNVDLIWTVSDVNRVANVTGAEEGKQSIDLVDDSRAHANAPSLVGRGDRHVGCRDRDTLDTGTFITDFCSHVINSLPF